MTAAAPKRSSLSRRRVLQLAGASAATITVGGLPRLASQVRGQSGVSGELIVAAGQDNYRLDPPERANIGMFGLNANVFESLVRLTPEYQIEPLLAESWTFVEPNTFRFTLRQGVSFHDGTPLTAEAVEWSMSRIAAAGGGSIGVDANSTVVIDERTVEITPTRPNRRLVEQLNHPNYSIVAPNSEPAQSRIGTGPFREVEYLREDRYVVEANEAYWGEDKPQVATITFRFMPDPTTRLLALQAGEVDLIYEVARESAEELEGGGDLSLATSEVGAYEALYIQIHGKEPYDLGQDPAVREAIAHAIDKDAIVNGVWQGNAEPSTTMIPPAILGAEAGSLAAIPYDPDRAKEVLDAAGWAAGSDGVREKAGRRLEMTMIVGYPSAEIHGPMPEFVQAQLAEVGIAIEIVQTPDTATYETRLAAGEGDIWAEAGAQNDGNPCFLPDLLFTSPVAGSDPEEVMYGTAFSTGEAFDSSIEQCRTAASVEEVQTAAANAMRTVIDDEFVVIPLAGTYRLYGVSARVSGFVAHPSGVNQRWTNVSIAE